jgi:hypothetical protein
MGRQPNSGAGPHIQRIHTIFFFESAGELRIILIREEKEVQNGPRYKALSRLTQNKNTHHSLDPVKVTRKL